MSDEKLYPESVYVEVNEPLPPAWVAITEIFTQERCVDECPHLLETADMHGTGDSPTSYECTVPTPRQCPIFKKENL